MKSFLRINGHILSLLFLLLCFTSTAQSVKNDQVDYQDVSLIKLIANPERYDGKAVRVIGFLNLEFEGDALYIHKEDFLAAISQNAIWVHINQSKLKNAAKCNKKYVIIEAVFDANNTGHMGMFGGALKNITRLDLWYQPNEKRKSR